MNTTYNELKVDLEFGSLSKALIWCDNNCQGKWNCDVIGVAGDRPETYQFYFEDERDMLLFSLTWK